MTTPLVLRSLAIAAVAALLLVPIAMIDGKIGERRTRAESATNQFALETTGPQMVAGPFLALTCDEPRPCPTSYFPPATLKITAKVPVEVLHRGIYPLRLYHGALDFEGRFDWPAPTPGAKRAWKKAYIVMAISDPRGIKTARSTTSPALTRASDDSLDRTFAIQEDIGEYASHKAGSAVAFGYHLDLAGTSSLHLAPVGDATEIRLSSDWPHPSFGGGWSPDERHIGAHGFDATWRTTHLATGGRLYWEKAAHDAKLLAPGHSAGFLLFDPINVYSLSYRATEYAFLFILFTFAALALLETLSDVRLHPIQYALVGCAIAVFFLLLIALSENIPFGTAYGVAAVACVALLTFYLRYPLRSLARTLGFLLLFSALYAALFVLLLSEDRALLLGSVMVFGLLAVVMIATRTIEWAEVSKRMTSTA